MPAASQSIRVRIICVNPPATTYDGKAAVFGLLDRHSQILGGQAQPDGNLLFECEAEVVTQMKTGTASLKGDYVWIQGPLRFFYLAYRTEDSSDYIKRIKISLKTVGWKHINALKADANSVLEVKVEGSGAATVPLLDGGWRVTQ
jgi:hypothetical protein